MFVTGRYREALDEAAKLPIVTVSKDEFVALLVKSGMTPEKAAMQAKIAQSFGSEVRIGDRMVRIAAKGASDATPYP